MTALCFTIASMDTSELVYYWHFERHWLRCDMAQSAALFWIALMVAHGVEPVGIGGWVLAFSCLFSFSAMMVAFLKMGRARYWIDRKFAEIPAHFRCQALRLGYEKIDAIECYEGHFPGDCPLCGAE